MDEAQTGAGAAFSGEGRGADDLRPLVGADDRHAAAQAERFDRLWQRHERQVLAQARREVDRYQLNSEDLHEIVQETRIALYQAIPRLGLFSLRTFLRGSVTSYLRGIVARRAADLARSRARRPIAPMSELSSDQAEFEENVVDDGGEDVAMMVLEQMSHVATAGQLRAAIGRLPTKQRDAIELVRLRGATYAEAAEVLGLAVGTVKSQVHDAIKSLKRQAAEEGWEQ